MSHLATRITVAALAGAALGALLPRVATAAGAGTSSNDFNPAIGLILTGTYAHLSHDPQTYAIPGFALGRETGPGERGLAIGESELDLDANVDPEWYGVFTLALDADGGTSVENAYVQTTGLGRGLTLRLGRFFSAIGYLDEQHAHAWDFVDTALPYRALLGTQYADDGVQVRWLAPTSLYAQLGAEWLRGDAFPGGATGGHGAWSAFAHAGGDVGDSHSWRAGLSFLHTDADERRTEGPAGRDAFTGTSALVVADAVWKWAPRGNPYRHHAKLQGEVLVRRDKGRFTPGGGVATPITATPTGWYVQGIYQFVPRWRVGLRYDRLQPDAPGPGLAGSVLDSRGHTPRRGSAMIDFSGSEFSRLRLQYNRDQSGPGTDHQWFAQYITSLGAHGAHIF